MQLSLIFIGVRTHSAASYPNQPFNIDDFVVISGSSSKGGKQFDNSKTADIGFDNSAVFFGLLTRHKFGHIACALDEIQLGDG